MKRPLDNEDDQGAKGADHKMLLPKKAWIFQPKKAWKTGWRFGTMEFYDFPYIGNSNPNSLSYFSEG
jgi:hypothetical protein